MSLWSRNERMRESWELTLGVYVLWVNMGALCTKQLVGSELTLVLWQQCMGSVLLIYKWILSVCVCMFVYRRGRLFIISSFCIVMHERDEKCLNNKLVSGSYSQECSWSALIGKPKIHFSLSSPLAFHKQLSFSCFGCRSSATFASFEMCGKSDLYMYRERKRDTSGDFTGLLQFISNTESNSFNLLTQLLIQVQISALMNDAITVKQWDLSLIHSVSNPS